MIRPPERSSLPDYYQQYYSRMKGDDLLLALHEQAADIQELAEGLAVERQGYAYAPGKWTLREVVGHLSDTERILAYRALRISRKDSIELPGFNENEYVMNFDFNRFSIDELVREWLTVRVASLSLFENLDEQSLDHMGRANGAAVSPRMLAYFIFAHAEHHLSVIRDRYLH
ncbi:MAG: DinB family protein [Bacteroidota bacterium]